MNSRKKYAITEVWTWDYRVKLKLFSISSIPVLHSRNKLEFDGPGSNLTNNELFLCDKPDECCITCVFFSSRFIFWNNLVVFLLMLQAKYWPIRFPDSSVTNQKAGTNLISRNFFVYSILAWARSVKNFPSLKKYYFRFWHVGTWNEKNSRTNVTGWYRI